jgi:hypothetical protein
MRREVDPEAGVQDELNQKENMPLVAVVEAEQ